MLAISSSVTEFLVLMGAGVVGAIILGIGRAVMSLVRARQTKQREDEKDNDKLSSFFFDQPRDTRTGTPATEGWTTTVNRQLAALTTSQHKTEAMVNKILYELTPNGGGNFRGIVEKATDSTPKEIQ